MTRISSWKARKEVSEMEDSGPEGRRTFRRTAASSASVQSFTGASLSGAIVEAPGDSSFSFSSAGEGSATRTRG